MIQYSLKCANGHSFDSWFQSADAFDKLHGAGMVSCATCGSVEVEKAMMAPAVKTRKEGALSTPASAEEEALAAMRAHLDANSEDVGDQFAAEARAMHEGDAPERSIHGQARRDEARQLLEDGIPVTPLPFMPTRKAN